MISVSKPNTWSSEDATTLALFPFGGNKDGERKSDPSTPSSATSERYMRRCIQLAKMGRSHAAPNPMVGAVVVHNDRIIGEGFHAVCGKAHAEVHAIESVRPQDRPLLRESTLYVSLEPCAHYGKTPPCALLIVRTGIPKVVVGCVDPYSRVQGKGIEILRKAGIDVEVGVLEAECRSLNHRFFTAQTKHRPFITLKWARSADGFVDEWRESSSQAPVLLSTPHSLLRVHRLRALHDAILVGHRTLTLDRPSLTVRYWTGTDPLRVVLGRVAEGELPHGCQAYADIHTALRSLYKQGVQSLLVEGGSQTLQSFIDLGLWDEAQVEVSSKVLGSGVPEPRMPVGVPMRAENHFGASVWVFENADAPTDEEEANADRDDETPDGTTNYTETTD